MFDMLRKLDEFGQAPHLLPVLRPLVRRELHSQVGRGESTPDARVPPFFIIINMIYSNT